MISTHKIGAVSHQVNQYNNYENYRHVIDSASPVLVETTIQHGHQRFRRFRLPNNDFIIEGHEAF